jgi:hypothetical protein
MSEMLKTSSAAALHPKSTLLQFFNYTFFFQMKQYRDKF